MTISLVAWFRGMPAHKGPNRTHPFPGSLALQPKAALLSFSAVAFLYTKLPLAIVLYKTRSQNLITFCDLNVLLTSLYKAEGTRCCIGKARTALVLTCDDEPEMLSSMDYS